MRQVSEPVLQSAVLFSILLIIMKKPVPTQNESPYGFHEFFFSTTNKRGVIRFGNDVFVRVSNYEREQLIGAPHSFVRHPDMPRGVFKVFWNSLTQEKPIAAYVKNLAGNGSYYWVFACAFPIDGGYLSIRFRPSSPIFQIVQDLYAEVLAFEQSNDSLDESVQLIVSKLNELGFKTYEDFMIHALLTEMISRSEHDEVSRTLDHQNQGGVFQKVTETTDMTLTQLNDIFKRMSGFQESNKSLRETLETLDSGFQKLGFISVNMTIAAAKFGNIAASLGVVSKEFSSLSQQIESNLNGLTAFARNLDEVIKHCTWQTSSLNLLMLMVDFFVKESVVKSKTSENAFAEMTGNKNDFSKLFSENATSLKMELVDLEKHLLGISSALEATSKSLTGLEVIRQIGAIESARVEDVRQAFLHYLEEMAGFIQLVRQTTSEVSRAVQSLRQNSEVMVSSIGTILGSVDAIFDLASADKKVEESPNL